MAAEKKPGRRPLRREVRVIEARRQQLRFGDGFIAEEVADLQEDWINTRTACWRTNN